MALLTAALTIWLMAGHSERPPAFGAAPDFHYGLPAPAERPAVIVQAADSPVRLERATILQGAEGPPIVVYSATNLTDAPLEQFTVMAFVFDASGALKARQVAPGRRTLDAHESKYSTLVLDGSPIDPVYQVVIGVNQAQRVGSETWWHADLQPAAEAAVPLKKK
jgi:hypothetical protein